MGFEFLKKRREKKKRMGRLRDKRRWGGTCWLIAWKNERPTNWLSKWASKWVTKWLCGWLIKQVIYPDLTHETHNSSKQMRCAAFVSLVMIKLPRVSECSLLMYQSAYGHFVCSPSQRLPRSPTCKKESSCAASSDSTSCCVMFAMLHASSATQFCSGRWRKPWASSSVTLSLLPVFIRNEHEQCVCVGGGGEPDLYHGW